MQSTLYPIKRVKSVATVHAVRDRTAHSRGHFRVTLNLCRPVVLTKSSYGVKTRRPPAAAVQFRPKPCNEPCERANRTVTLEAPLGAGI